jgi:hypothetical protein
VVESGVGEGLGNFAGIYSRILIGSFPTVHDVLLVDDLCSARQFVYPQGLNKPLVASEHGLTTILKDKGNKETLRFPEVPSNHRFIAPKTVHMVHASTRGTARKKRSPTQRKSAKSTVRAVLRLVI